LPDYSSKEIMKVKLTTAIQDGQYAFLLSWTVSFLVLFCLYRETSIYYKFFFLFFSFFMVCLRALINPNEKYIYYIYIMREKKQELIGDLDNQTMRKDKWIPFSNNDCGKFHVRRNVVVFDEVKVTSNANCNRMIFSPNRMWGKHTQTSYNRILRL
jgi:hypothetical protein